MEDTIQLTLTDMAHGGDAVGRYEGRVIFVPMALPGETVTVSLEQSRASYARGRLLTIDRPSEARVSPPCPVFGRCGGCQWQHINYQTQLELKRGILRDALERIGGLEEPTVQPMLGMAEPWRYRNHVQLRINRYGQAGYYAWQSHEIIATEHCLIAHPLLETMWDAHRACHVRADELILRAGINTGDRLAHLRGRQALPPGHDPATPYSCLYTGRSGQRQVLSGRDWITEEVLGLRVRVSADAFFQNNTAQTERLVQVARSYLHLAPGETLLDAYCGGGLLGLSLAGTSVRLLGIESYGASVRDARENSGRHGTFWQADVARAVRQHRPRADAIILDPPRTGCTPDAIEALADCGARRIVYVSCDPATLARDIARFREHGYALVEVQPVDMFPQTYHIECVALLSESPEHQGSCKADSGSEPGRSVPGEQGRTARAR